MITPVKAASHAANRGSNPLGDATDPQRGNCQQKQVVAALSCFLFLSGRPVPLSPPAWSSCPGGSQHQGGLLTPLTFSSQPSSVGLARSRFGRVL